MNAFDWKDQPAQVRIEDAGQFRHKKGKRLPGIAMKKGAYDAVSVVQKSLSGAVVKVYPTISSAARDLDITAYAITQCINGKAKDAGGFIFERHTRPGVVQ